MNWDAISTVAEIIAAVGVIVTLLYLARQIRDGNENERVDAIQQVGRDYATHSAVVMSDENVGAFIKGLNSYGDLKTEERVKFDICMTGYINVVEVSIYHAEADRVDELLVMLSNYLGPRLFAYPGTEEWWRHGHKGGFAVSTQEWVDKQIEKNRNTSGFWEYQSAE